MNLLFIGVAGFTGAISRYFLYQIIPSEKFPIATIVVNLSGCFLAGALYTFATKATPDSKVYYTIIQIGFIGSFTMFSTFGAETLRLIETDALLFAFINIAANIIGGIEMLWAAKVIVSHF